MSQGNAAIRVRLGVVGLERDGLVVAGNRGIELHQLLQYRATIRIRFRVVGPKRNGLVVAGNRSVEPLERLKCVAAIGVSFRVVWLENDSHTETGDGRVELPQLLQRNTTARVRLGEVGPERDGLVVARERSINLT